MSDDIFFLKKETEKFAGLKKVITFAPVIETIMVTKTKMLVP